MIKICENVFSLVDESGFIFEVFYNFLEKKISLYEIIEFYFDV